MGLPICAVETLRPFTEGYLGECVLSNRGLSKSRLCIDGRPSLDFMSAVSKVLKVVVTTNLERLSPSRADMILKMWRHVLYLIYPAAPGSECDHMDGQQVYSCGACAADSQGQASDNYPNAGPEEWTQLLWRKYSGMTFRPIPLDRDRTVSSFHEWWGYTEYVDVVVMAKGLCDGSEDASQKLTP